VLFPPIMFTHFDGCEYNKKKGRSKEVVSVETERGSS
jgi:hypothetical protein